MATRNQGSGAAPPPVEGLLGELERAIMEVVWERGEANVRDVHEDLQDRELAYTTVMTVMSRLAEKGVLAREKHGRAFVYSSAHRGRQGFLRQQARSRVRSLLAQFGDLAVAEFVDQLAETPEQIAALEALLVDQSADGAT